MKRLLTVSVLTLACMLAVVLLQYPAYANNPEYNVLTYGAVGDGVTDDTNAIRSAITAAGIGGTVLLPRGTYRISGTLTLDRVHMLGYESGGWPSDDEVLPAILVTQTGTPAVTCLSSSSVHGVIFRYNANPNANPPVVYAPTIRLSGVGISISNVKTECAYDGIIADGTSNVGRVNLENVFLVETIHTGVYITKAYDVATLRNVEVFGTNTNFSGSGTAYKFGRCDALQMTKCFVLNAYKGYEFVNDTSSGGGTTTGCVSQTSADASSYGYWISSAATLHITSVQNLTHFGAIVVNDPGAVITVTGGYNAANGDHAVRVYNCKTFIMRGARMGKAMLNSGAYGLYVNGGTSISVDSCTFDSNGPAAWLTGAPSKIILTNSIFESTGIVDNLSPTTIKKLTGNL